MIISRTDTIAANTASANILAGEQFEFLPRRSNVYLRISAAATGLYADILIGGVSVASGALVSDSNRFPITPDDNLASFGGRAGARLFVTLRNTTGAAITAETVLDIIPV